MARLILAAWVICALLAAHSRSARAEDADSSAVLATARELFKKGKYGEAWRHYKRALEASPKDVDLIIEAARAAMGTLLTDKALALVAHGRAVLAEMDPPHENASDLKKRLKQSETEAKRIQRGTERTPREIVDGTIKKLPKHMEAIKKKHLVAREKLKDAAAFSLRPDLTGPHFTAKIYWFLVPHLHLNAEFMERYRGTATARKRYDKLVKLVRGRRKGWEKKHRERTSRYKPELIEEKRSEQEEDLPEGADGMALRWTSDSPLKQELGVAVSVKLDPPRADAPIEEGQEGIWTIHVHVSSLWFKR